MITLAQDFRRRSEEQLRAAAEVLGATDFRVNPEKQAAFIVGKVTGNVLHVLADMVEVQQGTEAEDAHAASLREKRERNHALRTAAAAGNWEEFDRLCEGPGGGNPEGGTT